MPSKKQEILDQFIADLYKLKARFRNVQTRTNNDYDRGFKHGQQAAESSLSGLLQAYEVSIKQLETSEAADQILNLLRKSND